MSAESAAMERINESLKIIGMELKLARQERQDKRIREGNYFSRIALIAAESVKFSLATEEVFKKSDAAKKNLEEK